MAGESQVGKKDMGNPAYPPRKVMVGFNSRYIVALCDSCTVGVMPLECDA